VRIRGTGFVTKRSKGGDDAVPVRWAMDIPGCFVFEAAVLKMVLQPRRQDTRSLMSVRSPTWILTLGVEDRDGCTEWSREAERA
jgi:hypothetical protein